MIALVASVKANRMFQSWNTREKVTASTCCRDGSGESNADGCYEKGLADAFTTSFGMVSGLGTHKKGG
jgi:hypothetical protein